MRARVSRPAAREGAARGRGAAGRALRCRWRARRALRSRPRREAAVAAERGAGGRLAPPPPAGEPSPAALGLPSWRGAPWLPGGPRGRGLPRRSAVSGCLVPVGVGDHEPPVAPSPQRFKAKATRPAGLGRALPASRRAGRSLPVLCPPRGSRGPQRCFGAELELKAERGGQHRPGGLPPWAGASQLPWGGEPWQAPSDSASAGKVLWCPLPPEHS